MPALSLIVNPAAGRGRALQVLPQATEMLDQAGCTYRVSRSASLGHARELAGQAAADGHVIVAVGGDGMAGALAGTASGLGSLFGIIPAGRGNDLARVLGIPTDPAAAARLLARAPTRTIDLIAVGIPGQQEAIVAGSVYAGVPSVAGEIANGTRWLSGQAVYPLAALRAVARWRPARFVLHGRTCEYDFAGYAVVVANSAFFGAGMLIAPPARIDDGMLDLVIMRHGPKAAFLRALSKVRDGSHTELEQVSLDRDTEIRLTIDRAIPVAADGETLPFAAPLPPGSQLVIRILPAALAVIAPAPEPASSPG